MLGWATNWWRPQLAIWMSRCPLELTYREIREVLARVSRDFLQVSSVSGKMNPSMDFTLSTSRPASSAMEMSPKNTSRVSGSSTASFSSCQNSGFTVRIRGISGTPWTGCTSRRAAGGSLYRWSRRDGGVVCGQRAAVHPHPGDTWLARYPGHIADTVPDLFHKRVGALRQKLGEPFATPATREIAATGSRHTHGAADVETGWRCHTCDSHEVPGSAASVPLVQQTAQVAGDRPSQPVGNYDLAGDSRPLLQRGNAQADRVAFRPTELRRSLGRHRARQIACKFPLLRSM